MNAAQDIKFDPESKYRHLYLYTDFTVIAWAKDPAHFRALTKSEAKPIRVAHGGQDSTPAPTGYRHTGQLANFPIERISNREPVRRFVDSL